jgi:hypothetical protein
MLGMFAHNKSGIACGHGTDGERPSSTQQGTPAAAEAAIKLYQLNTDYFTSTFTFQLSTHLRHGNSLRKPPHYRMVQHDAVQW